MNEINIRFKKLREKTGFSQKEFGDKLGLSNSGISNIENGIRSVTDKHIKLICATFNVNEKWLRDGIGEPLNENNETIAAQIATEMNLDPFVKKVVEDYLELSDVQKAQIKNYIRTLVEAIAATDSDISSEINIDEEVESYRCKLECEKDGLMSQALPDTKEA